MPSVGPQPEDKPALVDVIHEWLGQSGLRKIWGIQKMGFPIGDSDFISMGNLFLRETDVPYFTIWPYRVEDKGDHKRVVDVYDPDFFTKLREMLDERERTKTIICRCPKCEGTKL